jgi:hypothetical protein
MDGPINTPESDEERPAAATTRRGRTRLYADAAEKQRAYRRRRSERLTNGQEPRADPSVELPRKLRTGKELVEELRASGLIGIWKDRTDIGDSVEFARLIRERAQKRLDRDGGAGLWTELERRRARGSGD